MAETNVDLAPPTINFGGVPMGIDEPLWWGFGTEDDPEDLTGRQAQLILSPGTASQTRLTPTVNALDGIVTCPSPSITSSVLYVLLLQDTPGGRMKARAQGRITPGRRVSP